MSPVSKYVDHSGIEKSFVDYREKHYGITIKDKKGDEDLWLCPPE
jgi:hypothetical protein